MGNINRRSYLIAIMRYSVEFFITFSLSILLIGLMFGIWEEWRDPFGGNLLLLIPIIYVMSRAVTSLHRVYRQLADLIQGPRTLVGYVTLHDVQSIWHRERVAGNMVGNSIGQRYMINVVPADAFARWLGKPDWAIKPPVEEAQFRYDPGLDALSTEIADNPPQSSREFWLKANSGVYPIPIEMPLWAFEMVRLGDLIRLTYARRTARIYNVEVMLSVMMPE